MRDLIKDYLGRNISRRSFIGKATAAGFTVAAARSSLNSLDPIVRAETGVPEIAPTTTKPFAGTGGELLAEQIRATGTRFIFICNSSGMGPLCDAVVDRPDLQFIQGVSENQAVAMADGFAKATGETSFACFSRVGGPIASANMYNAMKDRTPIVIVTDHVDSQADGRDGHEDLDDWLDAFRQYTKWRWLVKEGNRIPEWVAHAYKVSSTTPGGPTFVRIPRNVLYQSHKAGIFSRESISVPMDITPNPKYVERAAQMLIEAKSPILHVGHEVWTSGSRAKVVELAELLA
ncbi:MAG TPA: thiamine pyrophosphate-binding protein, partial [Pyrinomonadaceae bacterium]|nr:thiamine pyrophosphate-binding protein [Pyrinomonadaceae bacterium]